MPYIALAGSDPHVSFYRDELQYERRQSFAFERFTARSSPRDDAMIGDDAWPKEVEDAGGSKPIMVIPLSDGKYKGGRAGTNRHVQGIRSEFNPTWKGGDQSVWAVNGVSTVSYHEIFWHRKRTSNPIKLGRWNEEMGGSWALQLAKEGGPDLMDAYIRDQSWDIPFSLYYGGSQHIVYSSLTGVGMTTAEGGLGNPVRLHENICIIGLTPGRGAGKRYATWSPTTLTHETNTAYNLALMTAESNFHAGLNWVSEAGNEVRRICKLSRGPKGQQPEVILIVTQGQYSQIKRDPMADRLEIVHPDAKDQSKFFFGTEGFRWDGVLVFNGGYRGPTRVYSYYVGDTLATTNGPGLATGTGGNAATRVVFGFVSDAFVPLSMTANDVNDSATQDDGSKPWLSRDVAIGFPANGTFLNGLELYAPELMKGEDPTSFGDHVEMALDCAFGYSRIRRYNATTPAAATTAICDRSVLFVTTSPFIIS
jgi:hypothetical protein